NTALFAKQSSTVNAISGGRLTLGLAVGGREDDFEASGVDFSTRGRAFDRQLEELHELWNGKEVGIGGPVTPDGVPTVILGGSVKASFRRAARYGRLDHGQRPAGCLREGAAAARVGMVGGRPRRLAAQARARLLLARAERRGARAEVDRGLLRLPGRGRCEAGRGQRGQERGAGEGGRGGLRGVG